MRFNATFRADNRITVKPEVIKALNLKKNDLLALQIRKMMPGEVE